MATSIGTCLCVVMLGFGAVIMTIATIVTACIGDDAGTGALMVRPTGDRPRPRRTGHIPASTSA